MAFGHPKCLRKWCRSLCSPIWWALWIPSTRPIFWGCDFCPKNQLVVDKMHPIWILRLHFFETRPYRIQLTCQNSQNLICLEPRFGRVLYAYKGGDHLKSVFESDNKAHRSTMIINDPHRFTSYIGECIHFSMVAAPHKFVSSHRKCPAFAAWCTRLRPPVSFKRLAALQGKPKRIASWWSQNSPAF